MRIISIIILFFCFSLNAKTNEQYFTEAQEKICKEMFEKDGPLSIYRCFHMMVIDSEEKLSNAINGITNIFKKVNKSDEIAKFHKVQESWRIYRKYRCAYLSSGTEYGSRAYESTVTTCQAAENSRRSETLLDTPSFLKSSRQPSWTN